MDTLGLVVGGILIVFHVVGAIIMVVHGWRAMDGSRSTEERMTSALVAIMFAVILS